PGYSPLNLAQPMFQRKRETHLPPPPYHVRRQDVLHGTSEEPLHPAIPDEELQWQRQAEFHDSIVEKRQAQLQRHTHAVLIVDPEPVVHEPVTHVVDHAFMDVVGRPGVGPESVGEYERIVSWRDGLVPEGVAEASGPRKQASRLGQEQLSHSPEVVEAQSAGPMLA